MNSDLKSNSKTYSILQLAAGIIVITGVMAAQSIVIPIILSLFISIICTQPILWLEKKKVPWGAAMLIVLIVGGILLFSLGGIIGSRLAIS